MSTIAVEPDISQPKQNGDNQHPEIFAHHRTRILGMYGMSMLVMLMAGSQYGFSAYGPSIKTKLDFYQSDIELVSTLGNIGTYLGPLTGILVNLFTPFTTLTIGSITCLLGYGSMGLIIMSSNHTLRTPGWLGTSLFFAGFGSGLMYATCLAVNVHNIPPHRRGLSVAILVSLFGLSATLFTGIFNGWGSNRVAEFLITAAFMISSVGMVAAITIKRIDFSVVHHSIPSDVVDSSYLRSISSDDTSESTPINEHIHSDEETSTSTSTISSHIRAAEDPNLHPVKRVGLSFLALIRDTTFWMLFVTFVLVAGAGLMQINNMGELVKSLNGGIEDHTFTLTCITIFSLGNCGGRLIMAISDYTTLRRAWFLAGTSALMMLGHILQAYVFITKTYIIGSSILLGLAYGGLWSILPIIVSEAFGVTNFAINFGWLGVAPGIASAIFNSIAGALYQHQIATDAKNCIGSNCYRNAFIFASVASGVAMIVAIILVPRTQPGKKSAKAVIE